MKNVIDCPEAENDCERTVEDLIGEIDAFDGYVSRSTLESGLYCCNLNDEDWDDKPKGLEFWHPYEWTFDRFVDELLPRNQRFDRYMNQIKEKE